jgi:uncharacterized protein (TIGR02001 family)
LERACLAAAVLVLPLYACAGEFGGSVGATTDYVYRGLSQSHGDPAIQGDVHYRGTRRWVVGAWASSVDFDNSSRGSAEVDLYAGWDWSLDKDWDARVGLTHYFYPDANAQLSYDYDEVTGSLTWQSRISVTVAWSPNVTRRTAGTARLPQGWLAKHEQATSYELSASQPLPWHLSAVAGVGYYDLPNVLRADYVFWNAGFSFAVGRAQVGLMYIATDDVAKRSFGYAAQDGFSGSFSWRF